MSDDNDKQHGKFGKTKSTKDGKPAVLSNLMDLEQDQPKYVNFIGQQRSKLIYMLIYYYHDYYYYYLIIKFVDSIQLLIFCLYSNNVRESSSSS
jgi:hypothetical protein